MRSAVTELQNTIELRAMASEIAAPKPGSRRQSEKKTILKHFLKGFLEGKSLAPKWRKSADKSLPPHMHETQLKPHLQCGTDPRPIREYPNMIRPHTRPSRTRRTAEVDLTGTYTTLTHTPPQNNKGCKFNSSLSNSY